MTSDGRIDEAGCPTLDDFRSGWVAASPGQGAASAAAPSSAPAVRHRAVRAPGNFQYRQPREVTPRSRALGSPLTTLLPRGAPDCLVGLLFITTGTMETLWERELIDLLEGYGGEIRLDPKAAEWKRCNYLIRSYDGRDMQQRELIQSDKVTMAVRQQGLFEAGTRAFPLVIIENEQAVFDLIVRKSGGAAAAAAPAATASSSASTQSLPPEHGIVKTELWSLTDFLQHVEGGGGSGGSGGVGGCGGCGVGAGGAASSSSAAGSSTSGECLDPKPKTLVVVHGLHPGYAEARKQLFNDTLKSMQQVHHHPTTSFTTASHNTRTAPASVTISSLHFL